MTPGAIRRIPAARWAKLALAISLVVFGFTLCRRSITVSDEGYLLLQAWDMLGGKVLYRDLDSFVAPGVWFLLAGVFALVDPSVLATRIVALAGYLVTVWLAYRIVRRLATEPWAIATVVVFMLFTVWAFPAWTFSFYSPYAVCFALAALERVLAWQAARHDPVVSRLDAHLRTPLGAWTGLGPENRFLAIGLLLGLSIAFKQNYGVFAAIGCTIAVIATVAADPRRGIRTGDELLRSALLASTGLVLVALPFLAYFAYHGALADAFEALVIHPFVGFADQHTIPYMAPWALFDPDAVRGMRSLTYGAYALTSTSLVFTGPAWLLYRIGQLHVLLYWIPPVLFAAALVTVLVPLLRRRLLDAPLLAVGLVAGFVFLGVLPRADFNHLVHVYQPVIVLGVVLIHRWFAGLARARPLAGRVLVGACILVSIPYAATAGYWYVHLLKSHDVPLASERGGVLLKPLEAGLIDAEVDAMQELTEPGEPVLTVPGLAMLNFLADRPMPGHYYNLWAVHIGHDQGAGVIEAAERMNVELVVAEYNDFFSDAAGLRDYAPLLASYLRRYFEPAFSLATDKAMFLTRRREPLPDVEATNVLADCDVSDKPLGVTVVRHHLLFDSLYHRLPRARRATIVRDTTCHTTVPEHGGTLRLSLAYREPQAFAPGTTLRARIFVAPGREADATAGPPLLDVALPLATRDGWRSPPPVEHTIDLDAHAGRDVSIVFRTLYDGQATALPFDVEGFAMLWHDPRIEAHAAVAR